MGLMDFCELFSMKKKMVQWNYYKNVKKIVSFDNQFTILSLGTVMH